MYCSKTDLGQEMARHCNNVVGLDARELQTQGRQPRQAQQAPGVHAILRPSAAQQAKHAVVYSSAAQGTWQSVEGWSPAQEVLNARELA